MIIMMNISTNKEPRRGEINATLSGLGYRVLTRCYNNITPLGFGNCDDIIFYNNGTPLGLENRLSNYFCNPNTPRG